MSAAVIHLADRRAKKAIERLVLIQHRIDACARSLLAGRRSEIALEQLLDDMERTMRDLERTARTVHEPMLRAAIERTCIAHLRWSRARLGSDEERSAALVYMRSVDDLAAAARWH